MGQALCGDEQFGMPVDISKIQSHKIHVLGKVHAKKHHSKQFSLDSSGWIKNLGNDNKLISHVPISKEQAILETTFWFLSWYSGRQTLAGCICTGITPIMQMVIHVYIDIYVHVSVPLARPVSETEHSFVSGNPVMQHGRESPT